MGRHSFAHIHVVVNPAAGPDQPILHTLHRVFSPAGVAWDVSVTKEAGDAREMARAAAGGADIVAVYGGDGTVMEAAEGLMGSRVPLAILPGGTANAMAIELGIPGDLAEAAALISDNTGAIRAVDMGELEGRHFLLRAAMGWEAVMVQGADREFKDRAGRLAYVLSALKALADPPVARYRLVLDGATIETEGITCIVANSGNLGLPGISIAPNVDVGDGLLDVLAITSADLGRLIELATSVVLRREPDGLQHWQARSIEVESDPLQAIVVDGEMLPPAPLRARVVPHAVRILIPPAA